MTNTQLFISVAAPIFVVVIGFIWNNKSYRSDIATLRAEFRGEMNVLRAEMNGKFDVVNARLDAMNARLDANTRTLELIQQDLKHFHEVTSSLDKRVQALEAKQ